MLNSMQDAATQQAEQIPYAQPVLGPSQQDWVIHNTAVGYDQPDQDVANAAMAMTTRFIGRAIGKRVRRTFEERIAPAIQAKSEQMRSDPVQDQAIIVERYPGLRGCLQDQVIFLAGGTSSVPISEIRMPITLTQAEMLVNRLQAP